MLFTISAVLEGKKRQQKPFMTQPKNTKPKKTGSDAVNVRARLVFDDFLCVCVLFAQVIGRSNVCTSKCDPKINYSAALLHLENNNE